MADGEKRSKGIDAPMCKVCSKRHWGVCSDQTSGGYLTSQRDRPAPAERLAAAKAIIDNLPKINGKGKRK